MSRAIALRVATVGCCALILLHMDFWRPQRVRLLFGWLPEELAYRVAFIVLVWLFMMFLCTRVWREPTD